MGKHAGVEHDRELVESRIHGAEQTDKDAAEVDALRRQGMSPLEAARAVHAKKEKQQKG